MASKAPSADREPSAGKVPSADREPSAGQELFANKASQPSEHNASSAPLQWWSVIVSVLAAAFGVQSQHNYRRDFASASPLPFILLGVIFTVILVTSLLLLVRSIAH